MENALVAWKNRPQPQADAYADNYRDQFETPLAQAFNGAKVIVKIVEDYARPAEGFISLLTRMNPLQSECTQSESRQIQFLLTKVIDIPYEALVNLHPHSSCFFIPGPPPAFRVDYTFDIQVNPLPHMARARSMANDFHSVLDQETSLQLRKNTYKLALQSKQKPLQEDLPRLLKICQKGDRSNEDWTHIVATEVLLERLEGIPYTQEELENLAMEDTQSLTRPEKLRELIGDDKRDLHKIGELLMRFQSELEQLPSLKHIPDGKNRAKAAALKLQNVAIALCEPLNRQCDMEREELERSGSDSDE